MLFQLGKTILSFKQLFSQKVIFYNVLKTNKKQGNNKQLDVQINYTNYGSLFI